MRDDPEKCLKMIRCGGMKNAAGERVVARTLSTGHESTTARQRPLVTTTESEQEEERLQPKDVCQFRGDSDENDEVDSESVSSSASYDEHE